IKTWWPLRAQPSPRRRSRRKAERCRSKALELPVLPSEETSMVMSQVSTHEPPPSKYDRLLARAKKAPPAATLVVYPCDESSLRGAIETAEEGIIVPILVGPATRIAAVAREHEIDIDRFEIVDAGHSEAAAARAVQL